MRICSAIRRNTQKFTWRTSLKSPPELSRSREPGRMRRYYAVNGIQMLLPNGYEHIQIFVLLCAEFSGGYFEIEGDIIVLYPTLPFGWRGIPAYFSCVGHGITVSHKQFAPANKVRDGQQNVCSLLFVDDAISIEPRMGMRPEVCVS